METGNHSVKLEEIEETVAEREAENTAAANESDAGSSVSNEAQKLREELASERDARLRLAAEYDNYRRRTKLESSRAADEGKRELLEQMLTVADDLELAVENIGGADGAVAEGLQMISRRFRDMLEANGVVGFESKGERFDPERHEAFDVAGGTDAEPGTVFREVRRGYFWNGKLLRPALVVVAE